MDTKKIQILLTLLTEENKVKVQIKNYANY